MKIPLPASPLSSLFLSLSYMFPPYASGDPNHKYTCSDYRKKKKTNQTIHQTHRVMWKRKKIKKILKKKTKQTTTKNFSFLSSFRYYYYYFSTRERNLRNIIIIIINTQTTTTTTSVWYFHGGKEGEGNRNYFRYIRLYISLQLAKYHRVKKKKIKSKNNVIELQNNQKQNGEGEKKFVIVGVPFFQQPFVLTRRIVFILS